MAAIADIFHSKLGLIVLTDSRQCVGHPVCPLFRRSLVGLQLCLKGRIFILQPERNRSFVEMKCHLLGTICVQHSHKHAFHRSWVTSASLPTCMPRGALNIRSASVGGAGSRIAVARAAGATPTVQSPSPLAQPGPIAVVWLLAGDARLASAVAALSPIRASMTLSHLTHPVSETCPCYSILPPHSTGCAPPSTLRQPAHRPTYSARSNSRSPACQTESSATRWSSTIAR